MLMVVSIIVNFQYFRKYRLKKKWVGPAVPKPMTFDLQWSIRVIMILITLRIFANVQFITINAWQHCLFIHQYHLQ